MSIMDDLRTARYRRMESEYYSERLARLRAAAEGLGSQLGNTGNGDSGGQKIPDKMAQLTATIVDLERKLAAAVVDCECRAIRADEAIDTLPESQRMVMRLRYVSAMRWETIAEEMGYSVRQCHRIYDSAVERLSKK